MNESSPLVGMVRVLTLAVTLSAPSLPLLGAEVTITRTNRTERWITNVIDVRIPENRFVNVYHTNWIAQVRTNIVDVYATNWTMKRLTNQVEVAATWTNHVTTYHTNWTPTTLTNKVAVNLVRTNIVDHYHTNWNTLNLTNWQTVVLFKTNWITQPVTNVVQIDSPSRAVATAPAPSEVVKPAPAPAETAAPTPAAAWTGPLAIEAVRTARPPANDLVEVQMKVRRTDSTAAPPPIQQWRVEREDGAILVAAQDQDFKRLLPVGKYKVDANLKVGGSNLPRSVRGTLSVTTREAVVQPRLLAKK